MDIDGWSAPEGPLFAVVVFYRPDAAVLDHVAELASRAHALVGVVNGASDEALERLRILPFAHLIENEANFGLAYALNQGIAAALTMGAGYVLLLDQDTNVAPTLASNLLSIAAAFQRSGQALGCIGPVPIDRKRPEADTKGSNHSGSVATILRVQTVITSGMLIPRSAIERVNGMWNELFIDHIDHEWCFRAHASGLAVLLAPGVTMDHNFGDSGFTLFGAYKPIHRSPIRHYHIVRNTLWLGRRSFIPRRWRIREILKLLIRIPAYLVFSQDRISTAKAVIRAIGSGLQTPRQETFESQSALT